MTNHEDRVAPRTAAGRLFHGQLIHPEVYGGILRDEQVTEAILAIEAEAASLDSDELPMALRPYLDHAPGCNRWTAITNDCDCGLTALLSAGDKAKAPLDDPMKESDAGIWEDGE